MNDGSRLVEEDEGLAGGAITSREVAIFEFSQCQSVKRLPNAPISIKSKNRENLVDSMETASRTEMVTQIISQLTLDSVSEPLD